MGAMRTVVGALVVVAAASSLLVGAPGGQPPLETRTYSHAYYLFLVPRPDGCEDCAVPLLLTSKRLDELAQEKRDEACVVITTHERDSIVKMEQGVPVAPADVRLQERHVRVRGRTYRYQEVGASEVLRLLEDPNGTIPIHRTLEMRVPTRDELADLIASFRAVKE